ncbi:2-oxoacid:acceptor oxidoreductase subunit alpha [Thermodesulfobacteriota bacterium]
MSVDITVRIVGQAGQGMQSIGFIIGKIFTRHGYYVFTNQDVESRIRGGHSFVQVRVKDEPVHAVGENVDLMIVLDAEAVEQDLKDLAEDGVMIFDGSKSAFKSDRPNHFSLPLEKLAVEAGKSKIMINSVALGCVFALLEFDLQPLLDRLDEEFNRKGEEVAENNKKCASAGYRYVQKYFKGSHPYKLPSNSPEKKKMLISGSEAMALGAICSGLKFYAGYPMSPSTPIMEFVASMSERFNLIVEPAEDEIAAINMAIGASFAGARAMTATSGGGFCLMVEALGLAGMTETPMVIVVAQRTGPSTGMPTRTEQSDLGFVIHSSHGEFPRAVFAPGHAEQAFYLMGKAFNVADFYQTPVVVLGDQHLNDSYFTVDDLDLGQIKINQGRVVSGDKNLSTKDYKRYALDESGISPRILPGLSDSLIYADSDEHTEEGHITESAEVRKQMMQKRMRKLEGMRKEMGPPELNPSGDSDIVLLGWGSTYGAIKEAVEQLNMEGLQSRMLHFSEVFPFHWGNISKKINTKAKIFAVENNFTGQFSDLFKSETGMPIHRRILKYDGRPFTPKEIVTQVKDHAG